MKNPLPTAAWLILLLALLLRVGYMVATPGYELVHDATDYDRAARTVAAGEGWPLAPVRERPPLACGDRPCGAVVVGGVVDELVAGRGDHVAHAQEQREQQDEPGGGGQGVLHWAGSGGSAPCSNALPPGCRLRKPLRRPHGGHKNQELSDGH